MLSYLLNRQITIETETETKNSLGTPEVTYSTLKTTYANVVYNSGNTSSDEVGENAYTDANFVIRYDPRVNYHCRILFNDSYYKILHIEPIGRNEGLRIRTIMYEL